MNKGFRSLSLIGGVLLTLLIGFAAGFFSNYAVMASQAKTQTGPNLQMITSAWAIVNSVYVDRSALQSTPLTYGAIGGMVDALGDTGHSTFMTPQMVKQEENQVQGEYTGVGIEVGEKNGKLTIVAPIDGSPAAHAGLKAGEIILKVNGEDITGQSADQVTPKIVGTAGTSVTLTIMDPNTGEIRDVKLVRAKITVSSVSWQPIPGTSIADLRISSFSQGITPDLKKALTEIKQQGMTGIVLDLRDNPGGLLNESVDSTSQFLASGNVLLVKNAKGEITPIPVKSGGMATDIKMVVLVDGGTASAAEIMSGALQDAQRAVIVGEATFGTGTVLNEFPLPDGSALMLATEEWLTPSGETIWHKGITPAVQVPLPANAAPVTPDKLKGMTNAQLQASGDAQLLKAIGLLDER